MTVVVSDQDLLMHDAPSSTKPRAPRSARRSAERTRTLRILTLNLGLNALRVGRRFALSAHIDERLAAAPALIAALEPDIIALQEVYHASDQRFLMQEFRPTHKFAFASSAHPSLYGNGLMFLSRLPIRGGRFVPFRATATTARWLWEQGFLLAEIGADGASPLRFINVHLVANEPLTRPHAAATRRRRAREIEALIALAHRESAILVGDFNTSPKVAPKVYAHLIGAGYSDAFVATNGAVEAPTWDATNSLNQASIYRDEPSQRIDHVFLPRALDGELVAKAADVVLNEPRVALGLGQYCTLSDHYGLLVTLAAGGTD